MPKNPIDIWRYMSWLALWGLSLEGIGQELRREPEHDTTQDLPG